MVKWIYENVIPKKERWSADWPNRIGHAGQLWPINRKTVVRLVWETDFVWRQGTLCRLAIDKERTKNRDSRRLPTSRTVSTNLNTFDRTPWWDWPKHNNVSSIFILSKTVVEHELFYRHTRTTRFAFGNLFYDVFFCWTKWNSTNVRVVSLIYDSYLNKLQSPVNVRQHGEWKRKRSGLKEGKTPFRWNSMYILYA